MRFLRALGERMFPLFAHAVRIRASARLADRFEAPHFEYHYRCLAPRDRAAVIQLRGEIASEIAVTLTPAFLTPRLRRLMEELAAQPFELAWQDSFRNLVVTAGKDDILTHEFAASAWTSAWYMGLVDGTSTPSFAATDVMTSHAGWTENQDYTQAARPSLGFAAASAGSIALSSAAQFSINATATIAGGFFASDSTKGGTAGTLYSAGAFQAGNKGLANGDTLNVSATQSC